MAETQDILLDNANVLMISTGDFVCGESDQQHVGVILQSMQGDWKQEINVGVEIHQEINAPETASTKNKLAKRIKGQLEYDDYEQIQLDLTDLKNIQISCERI